MFRLPIFLTVLPHTACETARGFGRDVENTVSAVEEVGDEGVF